MKKAGTFLKSFFHKQTPTVQTSKPENDTDSDDDLNLVMPNLQGQSISDENWLLSKLQETKEPLPSEPRPLLFNQQSHELQAHQEQYIDFVVVVGFHHSIGAQVEFVHPPLQLDKEHHLSTDFLMRLPNLALPDGSHITEAGYNYFLLRDQRNTFHCVSCFRQIKAEDLHHKDESVSRTFVQKAVVVLSRQPLYGEIRSKLQPTTEAYFAQRDFKDTQILNDLFRSANQFNLQCAFDQSQYLAGLCFKQLFSLPGLCVLSLIKAMLLERRVIIYSKLASRVSSALFSLVGLLPGGVFIEKRAPETQRKYLEQRGWPLQVFLGSSLLPMVSVQDLDNIDSSKGYLLGTTNQLFLTINKLRADVVVDLDKGSFQCTDPLLAKHSNYEKKLFKFKVEKTTVKKLDLNGMLLSSDLEDRSGLMQRDEATENELRLKVATYLQDLCVQFALLKQLSGPPDTQEDDLMGRSSDLRGDSVQFNGTVTSTMDLTKIEHVAKEKHNGQAVSLLKQVELPKADNLFQVAKDATDEAEQLGKSVELEPEHSDEEQDQVADQGQSLQESTFEIMDLNKSDVFRFAEQKRQAAYDKQAKLLLSDAQFQRGFLLEFAKTRLFNHWLHSHSQIANLHPCHEEDQALIHFENQDFYKGTMLQGQRQGHGTFYQASNNSTYTGLWHQDKMCKEGQLSIEGDRYIYEGSWLNNMRDGVGMEVCAVRGKYTGQWEKDKRHGEGVAVLPNGDIYTGQWQNDLRHGKGSLQQHAGQLLEGEWHKDQLKKQVGSAH